MPPAAMTGICICSFTIGIKVKVGFIPSVMSSGLKTFGNYGINASSLGFQ
jgi:hypothetical protein